jgi:hypothetical protein
MITARPCPPLPAYTGVSQKYLVSRILTSWSGMLVMEVPGGSAPR